MSEANSSVESVRASRDGHTFHERWAARRALQLVFPKDDLFAVAVEGLSTNETATPGEAAEEIADLILYFGKGDKFETCRALQTIQFKYKVDPVPVTSSYLKKTIRKFAATLLGYEKDFQQADIDEKVTFSFVTNTDFVPHLWSAIDCLKKGTVPVEKDALDQYRYLKEWCGKKVQAERLFKLIEFQAATSDLQFQNRQLSKVLSDWTPGVDSLAKMRLHGLTELIREKAGSSGQKNNLVKREDILNSLECEPEDLFPADTEFVEVGPITERQDLSKARIFIEEAKVPVLINAAGGVGKTVFIQSLAQCMDDEFEIVIFDCFGGGSYRMEDQARHLPKIGLLQIVNELASRGLCDPQLPSDGDRYSLIKSARKRLAQAAGTVRTQSPKHGVLVVIDAADNAQREADDRNDDAFPSLLLASLSGNPIDGVKLVLTARPERMESVIGKSEVQFFTLNVFSESESRDFLASRRNDLNELEFSLSFARSGGNARVLDYLVKSWDENITNSDTSRSITVDELIEQRCNKIRRDLHLAGWEDDEIKEFFVAISLLPPPIPLEEMADALGWSKSKVDSAVADLAPMLELHRHGAIFRDEPTETFIRDNYGSETKAQQDIADRLGANQINSAYAAEALPYFLVLINDSQRAYELSKSNQYPKNIRTEHGRRRLRLSRLHAAFALAVKERGFDLVLQLTMKLARIAAANSKGDDFIRKSVGMSVCLGDHDASRRLFQDRTGWRGERDSRLAIMFAFQDEIAEAEIYQHRALGWIKWYYQNQSEEPMHERSGPSTFDFVSFSFLCMIKGEFLRADRNLANWSFSAALEICDQVLVLIKQYESLLGKRVLDKLVEFASGGNCRSLALQVSLLATNRYFSSGELKALARAASLNTKIPDSGSADGGYDHESRQESDFCTAALTALIHGSRQSANNINKVVKKDRLTKYDYSERYGYSRLWIRALNVCIDVWGKGTKLSLHHLLPREVEINRVVKAFTNPRDLYVYLGGLTETSTVTKTNRKENNQIKKRKFSDRDCSNITNGIELIISLSNSLQNAVIARREIENSDFHEFIIRWKSSLRLNIHPGSEEARDRVAREFGIGLVKSFLMHAKNISKEDCNVLIDLLSQGRFSISEKTDVLAMMARHENLQELSGKFAQHLATKIRQDEYIEQRSTQYADLANSLLSLSVSESQHYFREGLSQLDQMGCDDYDIIYSLLRYASKQNGGWIEPKLGHRLMNLCQVIFHDEPSKFGWGLFGQAAAKSVGPQAIFKIMRWTDQDVSKFSYGLPQLACYLAKNELLDARRAAFIMLLCEDHSWYEWKTSDGLSDILGAADDSHRSAIFSSILSKQELENPLGGSEYLWNGLLEVLDRYPGLVDQSKINALNLLRIKAKDKTVEQNRRQAMISHHHELSDASPDDAASGSSDETFNTIVSKCDLDNPHSIDSAIRIARIDRRFRFDVQDRILLYVRGECSPNRYVDFINMLPELVELSIDSVIQLVKDCVQLWGDSFAHIRSSKKEFVENIFTLRGSDIFNLRFTKISEEIRGLIEFCEDANFILELVFDTLTKERIELSGDEWIQLATTLCDHTSNEANLTGLEEFLSDPAAQLGDEIGEGAFRSDFLPPNEQETTVAYITWHLLGSGNTFLRWRAARSIKNLVDLGLHDDLSRLLSCFDQMTIEPLISENMDSSFLNSQQWLLIGLSRACFYHKNSLAYLQSQLSSLANRDDIHAINKIHILRCLQHICDPSVSSQLISDLREKIYNPLNGLKKGDAWSMPGEPKIDFRFDYEFDKHDVPSLARLFGLTEGEARDAITGEIQKLWPDAKGMDYFPGVDSYGSSQREPYESCRESVQRHALISAATGFSQGLPVIKDDYQLDEDNPWADWLLKYDITYNDGTWLTDQKDSVPEQAKKYLIAKSKNSENLEDDETILKNIGILLEAGDRCFPISGYWFSMDGVQVRITSALALKKGIVGRCNDFSRKDDYDIWLPSFGSDGERDPHIRDNGFDPLIWTPEKYPIGIDEGDEYATRYAVERAQLGIQLTSTLGIEPNQNFQKWTTLDGAPALENIAWGQWRPDPREHRHWDQDIGYMLVADNQWLSSSLESLKHELVLCIDIHRYKSYREHDEKPALRSVYVCLRKSDGNIRYWKAKKASKTNY